MPVHFLKKKQKTSEVLTKKWNFVLQVSVAMFLLPRQGTMDVRGDVKSPNAAPILGPENNPES